MGGFHMQRYRGFHVISSLLRSPMAILIIGWLKTALDAVVETGKIITPIFVVVYINYGVSKTLPCNMAEDQEFIAHTLLAVSFSAIQYLFVYVMQALIQKEEIQAIRSFIESIYGNIKNAYLESKVKFEKDMREFDVEAQMLSDKDN